MLIQSEKFLASNKNRTTNIIILGGMLFGHHGLEKGRKTFLSKLITEQWLGTRLLESLQSNDQTQYWQTGLKIEFNMVVSVKYIILKRIKIWVKHPLKQLLEF